MDIRKLFLASSEELKEDRREFEILIGRKNKDWVARGVFLELVIWEDFLDALSSTRLQDEYNKEIRQCDIFVMLFWTKVGRYTEEEFETAVGQFKKTNKPFIFTYFKDTETGTDDESVDETKLSSVRAFQQRLKALGHFYTRYATATDLSLHFIQQLDKLVANGFIEFNPDDAKPTAGNTYNARNTGNGAIAQGNRAKAAGKRAVIVEGNSTAPINTGTQIDTAGGAYVRGNVDTGGGNFVGRDWTSTGISPADLESIFAPLLAAVARQAPPEKQAAAVQQVQELKAEVAKGKDASDTRIGKIVDGVVGLVPGAVGAVTSVFATPILQGLAGPVTKFVLDKIKGS
jgi:hypothetical protein